MYSDGLRHTTLSLSGAPAMFLRFALSGCWCIFKLLTDLMWNELLIP